MKNLRPTGIMPAAFASGATMQRTTLIRLRNQYLKFSAAHFTIFSATERERLHGHNFYVTAEIEARVGDDGLCFDYNIMKKRLRAICESLDEYILLPGQSPYLDIQPGDTDHTLNFNGRTIRLPSEDCIILPLRNITAEELSYWILGEALQDNTAERYAIRHLQIAVSSGAGQSVASEWTEETD
ncbi:MAG: 6-carboxytetrahydropterin synthase [Pseudomonadota bacterium]